MFQLAWHIERPLATALIVVAIGSSFVFLRHAYGVNLLHARDFIYAFFYRRVGASNPHRADRAARLFLAIMAISYCCMSLLGFAIVLGIIRNGDPYVPPRSKESLQLQEYLEINEGQIDVKELIRKNEASRDPK